MNALMKWRGPAAAVAAMLVTICANAEKIEPPKVPVVDKNGVNVANGQVTYTQFTVAIGGAMGLSHSVAVHANEFNGFAGKFYGYGGNVELSIDPYYSPRNVYRVYDWDDTADFAYTISGAFQQDGTATCQTANFKFQALTDPRQILELECAPYPNPNGLPDYLVWTKPDGTVSYFQRGSTGGSGPPQVNVYSALVSVTYPNGFRINSLEGGMGARTNTGFQIKPIYEDDFRDFRCSAPNPIPGCKNDITTLTNVSNAFTSYASGWSSGNPRYIKGINNAIEYCPPGARDCVLAKKWPTATFNWAAGMPRTLAIGNTTVSVVDMAGRTTWIDFKAYDLAYSALQGGPVVQGYTLNREMSPRLVGIRSDGNDRKFTYDFKNVWISQGNEFGAWDRRLQTAGQIISAKLLDYAETGYYILEPFMPGSSTDAVSFAYGIGGIDRVHVKGTAIQGNPGAIYYVVGQEGTLTRDSATITNLPVKFEPTNGPTQDYEYDARSNLNKIVYLKGQAGSNFVQAIYPASCTVATRKTCNQATSIRDARGNSTYFTYHEPSGGVYTITYPANKNGLIAQTRFEYEQKSAHYFNGGASKITGDPIWMKVSERYCINSAYTDSTPNDGNPLNGSCGNSDEVVTRYEYNHDNLFLTGMTVTSPPPSSQTLRTCFKYDIYGNQIGKTEPNANLTSCP